MVGPADRATIVLSARQSELRPPAKRINSSAELVQVCGLQGMRMTPIGGGDGFKPAPSCNHVFPEAPTCRISPSGAELFRALLLAVLIVPFCFENFADAQTSGPIISEPCKSAQRISLPELDRKIRSLETLVRSLRSTRSQVSPQARSKLREIDEKIRANQETLIISDIHPRMSAQRCSARSDID